MLLKDGPVVQEEKEPLSLAEFEARLTTPTKL